MRDLPLDHSIALPQHIICGPAVLDTISAVYPNLQTGEALLDKYYLEGTILCPRNSEVDEINEEVLKTFPGEESLYSSVNSIKGSEEGNHYPVEYLNSIIMGGCPLSQTQDWDSIDAPLESGFEPWTLQWDKTLVHMCKIVCIFIRCINCKCN